MSEIALDTLEEFIAAAAAHSRAPKYMCIFDAFEKGIRDGLFKPGQRVPTESKLTERLPVSLGTLQRALTKLADTGLLVRNRKTGTFITDRRSQAEEVFIYRFTDPDTGRVMLPFVRVLDVAVDETDGPWRDALGVEKCVRMDRLVWVERDPPAFTSVYFAYQHGRVLLDMPIDELHGSSTHRVLLKHHNLPSLRKAHRIHCRALSEDACAHLVLAPGTVGTVWDVADYSIHDRPVLFQRLQLPPGHRPVEISEVYKAQASAAA